MYEETDKLGIQPTDSHFFTKKSLNRFGKFFYKILFDLSHYFLNSGKEWSFLFSFPAYSFISNKVQ